MDDCADHICIFQYIALKNKYISTQVLVFTMVGSSGCPQCGLHEKGRLKMDFELNVCSPYEDGNLGTRDSSGR